MPVGDLDISAGGCKARLVVCLNIETSHLQIAVDRKAGRTVDFAKRHLAAGECRSTIAVDDVSSERRIGPEAAAFHSRVLQRNFVCGEDGTGLHRAEHLFEDEGVPVRA